MFLKKGSKGQEVLDLQKKLNVVSDANLKEDGDFGAKTEFALKEFQKSIVSGILDTDTETKLDSLLAAIPKESSDTQYPPWVKWFQDRLGWTEFDHDKELSKGWHWTHLNYTSVIGADRAWCAMSLCTALEENGFLSSGSAAASSYSKFGERCDFKPGAILAIRHTTGKHHVTLFLSWKDEKAMIANCLGGNQSNKICIASYNLSGNKAGHDEMMSGGPRWPVIKK